MTTTRASPEDRLSLTWALFVGLLACWWVGPADIPLLLDNQVYFYIAERLASGVAPHISEFDPKNAFSMMLNAVAMLTGRAVGIDDLWAQRALGILLTASAFPVTWVFTRTTLRSRVAADLSVLALAGFGGFVLLGTMGSRPKVVLYLLCALVAPALAGRRYRIAGVVATLAFLTWQPALIVLGAAMVAAALGPGRVGAARSVAAGALVTFALYEAYFIYHGALADQLYQSFVFPPMYPKPHPGLANVFSRMVAWGAEWSFKTPIIVSFYVTLPLVWVYLAARRGRSFFSLTERPEAIYALVAASGAAAFSLYDYQGYPDRFFVLPFACATAGGLVAASLVWLGRRADLSRARTGTRVGLLVASVVVVATIDRPSVSWTLSLQRDGADAVSEMLTDGKSVYAIGCPHLLAMNRTANWNRFGFFPARVRMHFQRLQGERGLWTPERDGRWPDVVLLSRTEFKPNRVWLARRYVRKDHGVLRRQHVRVYELRKGRPGLGEQPPVKARPLP